MKITVNGQIIEVDGRCDNCHRLTIEILCKLKGKNFIGEYLEENLQRTSDWAMFDKAVRNVRNSIEYGDNQMRTFQQVDCKNIPVGSIILFYTKGDLLQHSMFVYAENAWIGANNGFSLRAKSNNPTCYERMSERICAKDIQGGWDTNGYMRSVYGDEYKMYYIPIL